MAEEQKEEISGASQLPPTDGAETAAAAAAAQQEPEGSQERPEQKAPEPEMAAEEVMLARALAHAGADDDAAEPYDWEELKPFPLTAAVVMAQCVAFGASVQFVQFFGEEGLSPDRYDSFCGAPDDARTAMVEYIIERKPTAETLFIKCQEWGGGRRHEGIDSLAPCQRAGLELLVRLVPAVMEAIDTINAEISRRLPPPEPGEAVPVPIEDTIFEEVPGFGDRMER